MKNTNNVVLYIEDQLEVLKNNTDIDSVVIITFVNAANEEAQYYIIVPLVLSCLERTELIIGSNSVKMVAFRLNTERCTVL